MGSTRAVILGIIGAILLWVIVLQPQYQRECFEVKAVNEDEQYVNEGEEPWQRHPINSVVVDPKTKFDTAYYYELDNAEYDVAITKTFQYPCKKAPEILKTAEWQAMDVSSDEKSEIREAYDRLLAFISHTLNVSEYMELPSDNPYKRPKIQVVHDILLQAKRHVATKFKYLIEMEVVLYREAKFNGKHVRISAIVEYDEKKRNWDCYVIETNVLGVVSEDQIGIFPVVATYNTYTPGRSYTMLEASERIVPDQKVSKDIVEKQNKLQAANAATNTSLSLE